MLLGILHNIASYQWLHDIELPRSIEDGDYLLIVLYHSK